MFRLLKNVLIVIVGNLFFLSGCSQSTLLKKDQEINKITSSWQASKARLLSQEKANAELKAQIDVKNKNLLSMTSELEKNKSKLNKMHAANKKLTKTIEGMREQNYDLEMMYETLSNRIVTLKNDVKQQNGKMNNSKKVISELSIQLKNNEQKNKKIIHAEKEKVLKTQQEKKVLEANIVTLTKTIAGLKKDNSLLKQRTSQMTLLQNQLKKIGSEKIRSDLALKTEKQRTLDLKGKLSSLTEAANNVGVKLPEGIKTLNDWELVKKITRERLSLAKQGKYTGDKIDIAAVSIIGGILFLFFLTLFFAISAGRKKRKLRELKRSLYNSNIADGTEEVKMEEDPISEPIFNESPIDFEEDNIEAEPIQVDSDQTEGEPISKEQEYVETEPQSTEEDIEVVEHNRVTAQGGEDYEYNEDDLSSTQVIPRNSMLQEEGAKPVESVEPSLPGNNKTEETDDDILGDLRNVINKRFDELLKD